MAYVIGSQKGKDIAKGMKTNESWTNPTDGSTWTKKADGSVSVTTSKGEKFDNAYTPTSSGGSSGGGGGGSSYNGGNSQYTGSSTGIQTYNTSQQAIKDQMNANSIAWWSADDEGKKRLEAENRELANKLGGSVSYDAGTGTWSGAADNQITSKEDIENWEYEQENERPTQPERDPRIDALLNEILNRDDFSYDAMNDPLYQQYAQMYQREGDRAMKETMAEAAAGAGGMNTYAITAAQQANSYYNSQLNDKIPQLYQLAYEMYLNDKESKVQDLGILQDMDATQYNRYRDTINDWYNDKNFAYGVYQDAVQQGNWQSERDYNAMWNNRYFDNENYWANKEFNANQENTEYNRGQDDKETAENRMMQFVNEGEMPSDELIAQAGWEKADVERLVAIKKKTYF